jgi:hypothetical protein
MNTRKWSKAILLFAVFTLTLIGLSQFAFCTGGSGGDGGGGGGEDSNLPSYPGAAVTLLSELSHDEIKGLMHGLNADGRSQLLDDYVTWPPGTTVKQLIHLIEKSVPISRLTEKERDSLLVNMDGHVRKWFTKDWQYWRDDVNIADMKDYIKKASDLRDNGDYANTSYYAVDYVNKGGKFVQTVLGYIPFVSLLVTVPLDVTREWAEGRIEEKDSGEIAKKTTVKAASSVATNLLSQSDNILGYATKSKKGKALQYLLFLGNKLLESKVGEALEEAIHPILKPAAPLLYGMPLRQNKVTKPTYTSSTGFGPGQTHQTQHTAQ